MYVASRIWRTRISILMQVRRITTNFMGCLPLAVTTHFCLTRGSKRSLVLIGMPSDGNHNAIWRYFVSIRVYLVAMLLHSWINLEINYRNLFHPFLQRSLTSYSSWNTQNFPHKKVPFTPYISYMNLVLWEIGKEGLKNCYFKAIRQDNGHSLQRKFQQGQSRTLLG